jgi:DNA-binding FadR family transcriptional regulator
LAEHLKTREDATLAASRERPLISEGLKTFSAPESASHGRVRQPGERPPATPNRDKLEGIGAAPAVKASDQSESALTRNRDKKLGLETALKLEKDFLRAGWSPGEIFGMQLDLQRRYNVGRWALREAIGILEMRGSAYMRRGRRGGLTIAQPEFENVLRACAVSLTAHRCTRFHLNEAQQIVALATARLKCPDIAIQDFNMSSATSDPLISLTPMTQNPAIEFIARIISALEKCLPEQKPCEDPLSASLSPVSIEDIPHDLIQNSETAIVEGTCKRLNLHKWMRPAPSLNCYRYAMQLAFKVIDDVVSRSNDDKAYIGSESEIAVRYNYSCETVRQASRILEDMGLIECRLGRNGGLITRKPRLTDVPPQTMACLMHLHVHPKSATQALTLLNEEILARNKTISTNNPILTLLVSILDAYLEWVEVDEIPLNSTRNDHHCERKARLVEELSICV